MIDPNGWPSTPRATWSQLTRKYGDSTLITWAPAHYDDQIALEARQLALAGMDDLPRLTRSPRSPSILTNGTRALADVQPVVARPWVLRLYYLSMAGERLYAEFSGLTEGNARALRSQHAATVVTERGASVDNIASSALDAQCWSVARPTQRCAPCTVQGKLLPPKKRAGCVVCDGTGKVAIAPPTVRHGFRKVVFPSERPEPVMSDQPLHVVADQPTPQAAENTA